MASIHHSLFDLPPKPPFPLGTSPFHIRGAVYLDDLRWLEEVTPGGVAAALERAEALRPFFQQSFRAHRFYDIQPLTYLTAASAALRGVSFLHCVRETARLHAGHASTGVGGYLLRAFSYDALALWLPKAAAWFDDFGAVEGESIRRGALRGARRGVPLFLVRNLAVASAEFLEEILRRAGAVRPRVHGLEPTPDGERLGYPLYRVPFEVTWESARTM
jgi:hypothetical protein